MSPITKYTFTNTKYIIPGAFIIISIIAAGLYLKATVFRGKPCRTYFFQFYSSSSAMFQNIISLVSLLT